MSTLEDRLRSELARSGRASRVETAPSVDHLAGVAAGRQRRNRLAATVGAAVVVGGLFVGGLVATSSGDATEVVAVGDDTRGQSPAQSPSVLEEPPTTDGETSAVVEQSLTEEVDEFVADAEERTPENAETTTALQAVEADENVRTRPSAVNLAGGSGVLVESLAGGTYGGLASRFGNDGATAIGLESSNGLDWNEIALVGVPDGATATHLTAGDGNFVALFSQPSTTRVGNDVLVGSSSDLVTWVVSEPLPGDEVFPQHLSVGPGGVLIVGDEADPTIWTGPVGGPYVAQDPFDQSIFVTGVGVVDGGFVLTGQVPELGTSLITLTNDGEATASGIESPLEGDVFPATIVDDTVLLGAGGEGAPTLLSGDAGASWQQVDLAGEFFQAAVDGNRQTFLSGSLVTTFEGAGVSQSSIGTSDDQRVELLAVSDGEALLLATGEGTLTWIVVEG